MKLSILEILRVADATPNKIDKIRILQQNASEPLKVVLAYALHPDIEWLLPPGAPPYVPSPELKGDENVLQMESKRLYLFVKGGHPTLKQKRREELFVNMLEAVTPSEAEFLIAVKDKEFPFKTITDSVVNAAFPGILPSKKK